MTVYDKHLPKASRWPRKSRASSWDSWEYIVDDFLETGCALLKEKRDPLLETIKKQNFLKKSVDIHRAFSINGILIPVIEKTKIRECWLYDPSKRKIEKYFAGKS
ncbi:MAG: hypothetical protein PHN49_00575 [Candidatus Omnitrophica bacterium]|nr:hypothetical protein [Candidatus Omnitrophota bacterium]MDD5670116.1 hypothetical protein [Candidatus Omnitrophota bacterium]